MAKVHILKNSAQEAVVKVYTDNSSGEVIDISLENDLTSADQVYVAGTSDIDKLEQEMINSYSLPVNDFIG